GGLLEVALVAGDGLLDGPHHADLDGFFDLGELGAAVAAAVVAGHRLVAGHDALFGRRLADRDGLLNLPRAGDVTDLLDFLLLVLAPINSAGASFFFPLGNQDRARDLLVFPDRHTAGDGASLLAVTADSWAAAVIAAAAALAP